MKVGVAVTPWAWAELEQRWISTLIKTALGNLFAISAKAGAILWHGPHLEKKQIID